MDVHSCPGNRVRRPVNMPSASGAYNSSAMTSSRPLTPARHLSDGATRLARFPAFDKIQEMLIVPGWRRLRKLGAEKGNKATNDVRRRRPHCFLRSNSDSTTHLTQQ